MLRLLITAALVLLVGALAIINNGHLTPAGWVATAVLAAWCIYQVGRAILNEIRANGRS